MVNDEVRLNGYGEVVKQEWFQSAQIRREIELDAFVIMPNHIHGIVIIHEPVGANGVRPIQTNGGLPQRMKPKSLPSFVAGFKSSATKHINKLRNIPDIPIWQRNYYEHIIRNENELNLIRGYIIDNSLQWQFDKENPQCIQDKVYEKQWARLEDMLYNK